MEEEATATTNHHLESMVITTANQIIHLDTAKIINTEEKNGLLNHILVSGEGQATIKVGMTMKIGPKDRSVKGSCFKIIIKLYHSSV